MKVSELPHIDPLWGYLELSDGSLVALPKCAIKELQAENEQLKKDLEHARSYKHTIKMRNRNLQTENERLKGELKNEKYSHERIREVKDVDLGMENFKLKERVKELEGLVSKMETTTPKWISVEDRLPCEDGEYQVVYKYNNGAMLASFDEWDNDFQDWMNATDRAAVVYWAELLPLPPTTEEK